MDPISPVDRVRRWRKEPWTFVREAFRVEPHAWQDQMLHAVATETYVAACACKGPGKFLGLSTEIYTPNGSTRWGDLQVGDLVFAEDGSPTEVTGVYPQGEQDIYRVEFDDHTYVECGFEHLWKVRGRTEKRHGTWSVLSTQEIIDRGIALPNGEGMLYHQFQIPRQGPAQFPERELPIDPYVYGAWLGDGTRGRAHITSTAHDTFMTDKIMSICPDASVRSTPRFNTINFKNHEDFRSIPGTDKGSKDKFIADMYKTSSIAQRTELLRGLMDTDGCISPMKKGTEYNTISKQLAHDVAWLVRSLGGKAKVRRRTKKAFYRDAEGNRVYCNECYRVSVAVPVNPFSYPKKAERWFPRAQERYYQRTIKSITFSHREEAMCISVAHPSRCYLANDFIVTHNTCVDAWIILWFLFCHKNCNIAAMSITADNLRDGLWKELGKWIGRNPELFQDFEMTASAIKHKRFPNNWWVSARSFPKSADINAQANSLAGLHEENMMIVMDEVSDYPPGIVPTADAAMGTVGGIKRLVATGNPTDPNGPLGDIFLRKADKWHCINITGDPDDPNRSPQVSIDWAREQIAEWGADDPWVLVNVFGRFPPSAINSLITAEEVHEAQRRRWDQAQVDCMQKRIGVDVARFGDDRTVIYKRQGLFAHKPEEIRGLRSSEIADIVIGEASRWGCSTVFVDETGGWGASVLDAILSRGFNAIAVNFSSKPMDSRFANKRAEIWMRMVEWIKRGGCLTPHPDIAREISEMTYTHKMDKLLLERKEQYKKRTGVSPDLADALALTFAIPDMRETFQAQATGKCSYDYDPLGEENMNK